jgi:carbonic anhydrase/acetyltransferase-like protein (isoleucine patch superfamily)
MTKKYELTDETKIIFGITLHRIKALRDINDDVKAGSIGGWVQSEDNLSQNDNAWVYGNARVYENAQVSDNAQVYGDAWVCGDAWVSDNAQVYGDAWVCGDAWVYDNAQVYGDARVSDNAWVYGDAWVSDNAWVSGDARVSDGARVSDNAWVYGDARVYGDAWVYGNARVYENAWRNSPYYVQGTKYAVCMTSGSTIKIGCQDHSITNWLRHGREIARRNGEDKIINEYALYVITAAMRYGTEDDKQMARELWTEVALGGQNNA